VRRTIVIEADTQRRTLLFSALHAADCEVIAALHFTSGLSEYMANLLPDLVIISLGTVMQDQLDDISAANQNTPRPLIVFTEDGREDSIRAMTRHRARLIDGAEIIIDGQTLGRARCADARASAR
jgi:two-component system, response regulator / RNA-binding antiterminator